MGDKVKVGYSIDEETSRRIKQIAELTHRADSHVIDWLVAKEWALIHPVTETGATAPISDGEVFAGA